MTFACHLPPDGMADRAADLRALMGRALLGSRREPRLLHLSFGLDAEAEVRRAVELERECCPFLTFDVAATPQAVEVRIAAPDGAEPVLDAFAGLAEDAPA
jgi:hypothetical protein